MVRIWGCQGQGGIVTGPFDCRQSKKMCGAQRGSADTVRWCFDPPEADLRLLPPPADVGTMSGLGRQQVNNRKALPWIHFVLNRRCNVA